MYNVIEKNNWKVHWRITESAGLSLFLVDYKGKRILWEAALPYVTVDHQTRDLSLDNEDSTDHGSLWLPMGERSQTSSVRIDDFRGGFEISVDFGTHAYGYTQVWRFHEDGRFSPWLIIHGHGVHNSHTYHPHWRFDFDLNGADNDIVERFSNGNWETITNEGWFPFTGESDENGAVWRQADTKSKTSITIRPHLWEDAELFALRYHSGEWIPPSPQGENSNETFPAAYAGSEDIEGKDVALWYVAHVHYDTAFPFTAGPWIQVSA